MPQTFSALPKCIATVCLSGTLAEKLEAAAAAGFDGVEIFEAEFWHLCTDAFHERFFFGVVQRGGGYAGFGAANAPVRAAAQARQHPADAAFL